MNLVLIRQNTPPWHAWRANGIGGSDAPIILGVSPYKTVDSLLKEKLGKSKSESTFAMRKGQALESTVRKLAEESTGYLWEPACVQADEPNGWMRASLDGVTFDERVILECKYNNETLHDQALAGTIPDHHMAQIQHQLFVSGAGLCVYASYNDASKYGVELRLAMVEVEPDAEMIVQIIEAEEVFWERLQEARMGVVV